MQITAKRHRQGGWKRGRKLAQSGKEREEVLKRGPNKTTRGDLKGRKVDFKGSEREVIDLEKRRLKL